MKTPTPHRRFLLHLLWTSLALSMLAALFTLAVDPFGIFEDDSLSMLAPYRTQRFLSRIGKAELFERKPCEVVLLGASSTDVGIDPEHPAWGNANVCNLALTRGSLLEAKSIFERALEKGQMKRAFLGTDFLIFASDAGYQDDFLLSRFYPSLNKTRYYFEALWGYRAFLYSARVLKNLALSRPREYTERGFRAGHHLQITESQWRAKLEREVGMKRKIYSEGEVAKSMRSYEDLLQLACSHGIELQVALLPSHALEMERLEKLGLSRAFQKWLAQMKSVTDRFQKCSAPIRLWEMSILSPFSREPMPAWFWDGKHFKKDLGNKIVERIYQGYGRTHLEIGEPHR